MNKTIWKYKIEAVGIQQILLPIGAEILTVQIQDQLPCIWVMVDPENETEVRVFEIFGTGHNIYTPPAVTWKYIGTFQVDQGALVFHLFERLLG